MAFAMTAVLFLLTAQKLRLDWQRSIETGDFDFNTGHYSSCRRCAAFVGTHRASRAPSCRQTSGWRRGERSFTAARTTSVPALAWRYRVNDKISVRADFGISYDNWAAIIQMTQNYQDS